MSFPLIMLYIFEFIAAVSAIGILLSKNLFKATLLLLMCLISIAGIYVLCFAEFVAVTQILIYAGGIVVVLLFAIMLTQKKSDKAMSVEHTNIFSGIAIAGALFFLLAKSVLTETKNLGAGSSLSADAPEIGKNLITNFALPFELIGIVLLVALIGAAIMASTKNITKT
jgi:NADH:ubiquinone oxidoreductase subunit 6 (subunit J)